MKKITLALFLLAGVIATQAQNKLLSSIDERYENNTWIRSGGTNYEYDSNNNLITTNQLFWDTVTQRWLIAYRTRSTYNTNNKLIKELSYTSFDAPPNTLIFQNETKYVYDTAGKLTTIYEYFKENGVWLDHATTITYNANNLPINTFYWLWDGAKYVQQNKSTLTYNATNKVVSNLDEFWNASSYVKSFNYLNSYDSNGKLIAYTVQEWDSSIANWVQQSKTDYVVSTAGNRLTETYVDKNYPSRTEYSYDTSALMSSFVHPFKDQTGLDYIFNEELPYVNKINGYTYYSYNQQSRRYEESWRTTYNYNAVISLGTDTLKKASDIITVFPNPTEDFLIIQNESNTTIDKAVVTDMTGKVLQQSQNANKIDVQFLPKGMYLLQVSVGDKKETRKFLKK